MVAMIRGAFVDAVPLMRSRAMLYIAMAVLCAAIGLFLPALSVVRDARAAATAPLFTLPDALDAILWVVVFFVYPSVAQTERSEFRMTVGRFFGIIGIWLVFGIETVFGFVAFIGCGFWISVKWSLSVWTFLLGEGKNPFSESWALTTGQFWETFAFTALLAVAAGVPWMIGLIGVSGNVTGQMEVAVVLRPIAFLIYVYALHVFLLGQMRWMLRLRERVQGFTIIQATV